MLDFLLIATRKTKGGLEIYPKFIIKRSKDLMIRGGDFYAIWVEDRGLWSTDEQDAIGLIDHELEEYYNKRKNEFDDNVRVSYLWDASSGMIDSWHKYCQRQMRDSYEMLDEILIFSNTETKKSDYASKKLPYPLENKEPVAWNKLVSTLYSESERHKIEWCIGSIVSGESKILQKFAVFYGSAGTGKSTILNVIQKLFEGYYSVFDAKALGSSTNSFALEAFRSNPLVAIQHDGDLSKIEDNTRLNSLVAHETMTVNEKFKSTYSNRFKCFLFMGTNKPVKITDAKSGLLRRLIDIKPSGNKIPAKEYRSLMNQINFELGSIATKCKNVYLDDPNYYDDYVPLEMMGASNDFYNFMSDSYFLFEKEKNTSLRIAWERYKAYCDDAKVAYPFSQRVFKEELKNYYWTYEERGTLSDGTRGRNLYFGFRTDKFITEIMESSDKKDHILKLESEESILDRLCGDCYAQYANENEKPISPWSKVTTRLSDLDTTKTHYVKLPREHIVIDFDISDENGNKSLEQNLEEAFKWPPTYAELSKSGQGVHLHYIYTGDVSKLSRVYSDKIEIKVFTGNSSLRRKLSKCNNLPVAKISSGLPTKGDDKKMIDFEAVKSEKSLRMLIKRNLNKEIHPATKPSVDFIYKILEDAYNSDLKYDVSDMRNAVLAFAASSTNQPSYCIKLVSKMQFKSEDPSESIDDKTTELIFFDTEVFPNLFLLNWKVAGKNKPVVRLINPTPGEIEELLNFRLIGFNNRRYDNHILYARMLGYTNEQLYNLSQKIISSKSKVDNCFFGEAYNISYTDVYDFASAANKMSLKKWEIELGIHHKELGIPWDQPVPEERWNEVAEYCDNDVIATEAVFNHLSGDWAARQILADLAGGSVNDTTNSLSTKYIFGSNKHPQDQFNYRDMGEVPSDMVVAPFEYDVFDERGRPIFPGYKYEAGVSTYRGEEIGEGGYVYSEPGMYTNVALLDVASMHPSSIEAENLFGDVYTKKFNDLKYARIAIKHNNFEHAVTLLGSKVEKYLRDEHQAKALSDALKTVINSVYGLTSASFENPFRDNRNKDNIVAKRGALFMVNLKHAVQEKGYCVAHIKTDSIKIPNADKRIIDFVIDYGQKYGYTFEHEATYERMVLANKADYVARYDNGTWTATGAKFSVPYVFKKLFSKEEIVLDDLCETKAVKSAMYLDMNEGYPDVSIYEKELEKRYKPAEKVRLDPELSHLSEEDLMNEIKKGHNYYFVGKVGSFCPILKGFDGGLLVREQNGKYYSVSDTKGYRWLEAETVKNLKMQDKIDLSYYDRLVDDVCKEISELGDLEWFIAV